ncbi:hypothetical protein [Pontibacillus litoralis]|uniref:Uncharacterized protein n=1 Tax=Pontibacillus litoralis JSM 072002 TaxID=1385512 RepID=A0A0A5HVZ4_9BACI|nr:hypothetical protein [Pontibacillus litoralis]KGX87812.1 hypothetical protein N784_14060 [Pontibacillus litoralis JSM 072002]
MRYLIWGCYSGIGFHFVQACLEKGHFVYGVDGLSERKEMMAMFIGRNAHFTHFPEVNTFKQSNHDGLDCLITVYDIEADVPWHQLEEIPATQRVRITSSSKKEPKEGWLTVHMEHYFGPWLSKKPYEITSKDYAIEDLIHSIFTLSEDYQAPDVVSLPNDVSIITSKPIENRKEQLAIHRRKFSSFYK